MGKIIRRSANLILADVFCFKQSLPTIFVPKGVMYSHKKSCALCYAIVLLFTYGMHLNTIQIELKVSLPSGFFPSGVSTKTRYAPLLSSVQATSPTHLILLDLIT
jgi:hypothetical protein